MANPTVVAGSAVGSSSSTSITKPTTSGYTETTGDLILVQCETSGTIASGNYPTPPTGFTTITQVYTSAGGGASTTWAYKVDSGSETWPKSFTPATGTNEYNVWSCVIVRGQDSSTPLDGTATTVNDGTGVTSESFAAITASVAGDLLVIMLSDVNDQNVSGWPTGVTEYAAGSNPTGNGVMTGTKANLASGTTGTLTVTMSGSQGTTQGIALLVKAPSTGGATAWTQPLTDQQSVVDSRSSQIGKYTNDAHSAVDLLDKSLSRLLSDVHSAQDSLVKVPSHWLLDYLSSTDVRLNRFEKTLVGDAASARDGLTKLMDRLVTDTLSATDHQTHLYIKALNDFVSLVDSLATLQGHALVQHLNDWFSETSNTSASLTGAQAWKQTIADWLSETDVFVKSVNKPLGEDISALDVVLKLPTKWVSDHISELDALTRLWTAHLVFTDLFSTQDIVSKATTKLLQDHQAANDFIQKFSGQLLTLADSFSETDEVRKLPLKALAEAISSEDALTRQMTKLVFDSLSATDRMTAGRALLLALQDYLSSADAWTTLHSFPTGIFHLGLVLGSITNLLGLQISLVTPSLALRTDLIVAIKLLTSIL